MNRKNIQDLDTLENFCNVIGRLKVCLENADFRMAGPLVHLGAILLKIESEKLIMKHLDEEQLQKYIMDHGPLYRMEIDLAVQEAYLSLLSRCKDKIVIEGSTQDNPDICGIDVGGLNRRRQTDEQDMRAIIDDDAEYETVRMNQMIGEHQRMEAVSSTMMEGFDMEKIMEDLRSRVKVEGTVILQEIDMDYLDAFMASLYLACMGEVRLQQESFGAPIAVSNI